MANVQHKALGGRFLTLPVLVLMGLIGVAAYFLYIRFTAGIGAVANINDGYPWGIWVVFDIVIGTAIGCGGYAMALLTYIFNKGEYHPLVRPALLGGLFGYTLAGIAVLVDLGRWWQGYNIILPWYAQPNSVMFEVALCVAVYTTVLWIEFLPAFLEKFGLQVAKKKLERVMFFFVALGVLLPTMHQSSLGSLLLVLDTRISDLWFTGALPLLFLMSALLMGYTIVIWEGFFSNTALGGPNEDPILQKLSRVMLGVLVAFLALRVATITMRGGWSDLTENGIWAFFFFLEMGLYLVGGLMLAVKRTRRTAYLAALALLIAGSLYRVNAYLIGYEPVGNFSYFPAVGEIMITVGIFALEIVLYLFFVKKLPVLARPHGAHSDQGLAPHGQA
ncbi:MAG: Ni/Fe-hydrogenase cytochrome b subunit [Magnetovibrionaceae bacterium]